MDSIKRLQKFLPNRLLSGRYSVIQQLGAGGFSQTFLAKDTQLPGQPLCVVKQLKPQINNATRWDLAKRLFDTEAAVLYQLGDHDQIPRLLAHFEDNREFYLVQEFIEGESLDRQLLPGQPWPQSQVVRRLHDLLSILHMVHQQQVIHRDIKPSNLICRQIDDRLVMIDFGAVKQVSAPLLEETDHTTTISIGTQGYMPSEQISGNPRFNSDLYAVGVIGIQALTGIRPSRFQRDLLTGEILWRNLGANVLPELAEILDRLVRYHFRDRYQTAAEPLAAIERLLEPPEAISSEPAELTGSTIFWSPPNAPTIAPADYPQAELSQPGATADLPAANASSAEPNLQAKFLPDSPLTDVPETAAFASKPPTELHPTEANLNLPAELDLPATSIEPVESPVAPANSALDVSIQAHSSIPTRPIIPPIAALEAPSIAPQPFTVNQGEATQRQNSTLISIQVTPWMLLVGLGSIITAAVMLSRPIAPSLQSTTAPVLPTLPCQEPPPPPLPSSTPDYKYPDGTRYYGRIQNKQPADGRATMMFANGNRYDGEFSQGQRNGCGTYSFANGKRYIGQFKADRFEGEGIWLLGDGNRYVGGFKDNRCHGEGIFLFEDGKFERGTWQHGKLANSDLSCDR